MSEDPKPHFIIMFTEGDEPGSVNIEGAAHPAEVEPGKAPACHAVGAWMGDNFEAILSFMRAGVNIPELKVGPPSAVPAALEKAGGEQTVIVPAHQVSDLVDSAPVVVAGS